MGRANNVQVIRDPKAMGDGAGLMCVIKDNRSYRMELVLFVLFTPNQVKMGKRVNLINAAK